jgi:hypothetical protein
MPATKLTIEQVMSLLAAAPLRITALTDGLTPGQLRTAPADGEWSTNDVLAHLRACADVWGDCITTILAQDRPTLRAISPRTWITKTDYPAVEFRPSLDSFSRQRDDLLAVLESLPQEAWSRPATVKRSGKTLERTVFSYAQLLARHEQPHIEQIEQIVNMLDRYGRPRLVQGNTGA